MAVFDGVCYSLSLSLSPTRRKELAAVLDLNGAASRPPYTHFIAPAASHAHHHATGGSAVKLVTDRWVDRSIVMGKCQPEQYYSPDPAMIFSGVVASATDLSAADLEVLSAGITALGGQWRVGLTRDVTHLFALRTGSDKYNTALHFTPQTHICILTPHWFDDAVRLGRRIPEAPYTWPDPPVLRPGVTLDIDEDPLATEGKRRRRPTADTDAEAGDGTNTSNEGEFVRVWAGRRILLSPSLELTSSSQRAIEVRIQRAGGVIVPIPEDADEDVEEKSVDESDVLITRWRSGKSYFKAARASLLIGTLSWLFSVESSGTLHSPLDSLLWYPIPRGGILGLVDCEISVTNYTGAARDYLKRLITLVGAKFTPSMSQSNKVLVAGFQPSPKTTRALSWSIPVVNHTWLEDCVVEWRALTVGLERYIVYPPGVDFGKILMTPNDGPPSSQSVPTQGLSGGAVPGGRGIGAIDLAQEETRDMEFRARSRKGTLGPLMPQETFANAAAEGMSMAVSDVDALAESRAQPRSPVGLVKKTPSSSTRVKRGSISTPMTVSATGAFVDQVIELPPEDCDEDGALHTSGNGKQYARNTSVDSRAIPRTAPRRSSVGLFSTAEEVEDVVTSSGKSKSWHQKGNGNRKRQDDSGKQSSRLTGEGDDDDGLPKPGSRHPQHRSRPQTAQIGDMVENPALAEESKPRRRRATRAMATRSDTDSHPDGNEGEGSNGSAPPRRPTGAGSATPVKSGMKPRLMAKLQSGSRSILGGESDDEVVLVAPKSGGAREITKWKKQPSKSGRNRGIEKGKEKAKEESETKKAATRPRPRSPIRPSSPTLPNTKNSLPSKRQLSVIVPSVPKGYFLSQSMHDAQGNHDREVEKEGTDLGATSRTTRRQLTHAASMNAIAAETSAVTNKRGKPSPKIFDPPTVSGKPPTKGKAKPDASGETDKICTDDGEDMVEEVGNNDISAIIDAPVPSTSRGPRRSAANKATTRLRDEIMPDVVNYEKEQKQAKRRRSIGEDSVAVASMKGKEHEERGGKRRKTVTEEEAEVEDVVLIPTVKAMAKPIHAKAKAKATTASSDDEVAIIPAKNKLSVSQEKKGARGRDKELSIIRLITTGVGLPDDVIKRLTKLGVQMTTKPLDCTHLIAKGIVRTEKFLCAMSVSPYILTEEWAIASAKSGKLLPENDYLLSDATAEKKWAFKFADAMARAKRTEGGPNLFKQMTFYVTPKVSVDAKLLKNIISAGGGHVQASTIPTIRILKGNANRFVLSCPEDKGIWRPLVQEGFKIYSPELVLRGSLRQEIEWERRECLIAG